MLAAGNAVIYITGTAWLAVALHVSATAAIGLGVMPLLVTDALKITCATVVLPSAWRLTRACRSADT